MSQVRQYLHATADKCDNWNEVTSGLREYCALRQRELAQWVVEQAEKKRLRAMPPPGPSEREIGMREEQIRREIEVKCRSDVAEWKQRMEEEIKRRDQDDARRRELEDKEWRADAMRRRAEMEEAIRKEEEQWKSRLIDQVRRSWGIAISLSPSPDNSNKATKTSDCSNSGNGNGTN